MINHFFKNKLFRDVATLVGGTGIAQALPVLISPILTRIYSPDEFGILAFYMAAIAIIGVASTGRYEMAVLLPKKNIKAYNLAGFSVILSLAVSLVTFAIFLISGNQILDLFGFSSMSVLYITIPAGIFAFGLFQVSTFLLNRLQHYKGLASAKIARSGGVSAAQVLFGFTGFSTFGLVFGKLLGDLCSAIYAQWLANRNRAFKDGRYSWIIMKAEALTYREMPKINAPHAVSTTLSNQLPNMLLAGFFNPAIAGFYNLSFRVCYAPVMLISGSVYQVYSRSVSENQKEGDDIHRFTLSIVKKLALAAIIPFSILLFFAPSLFDFIFGAEWRIAGAYAQLLTPMLFLTFIVSPVTYIPILLGYQRKAFFLDLFYLVLRIAALSTGFFLDNAALAIAGYSIVGVLFLTYLLFWLLSLTKKHNYQKDSPYKK